MKKLFIILAIVLFASFAYADTGVNLAWDANTEPDLVGYRVFRAPQSGGPYAQVGADVVCGPNNATCCAFTDTVPDGIYFWVVLAFDNEGNESGYSNEVTGTYDTTAPGTPTNLRFEAAP